MRPLIEILEHERTLTHKLESVYRYLGRVDDIDTLDILAAQKKRVEGDLAKVRNEMREYITILTNGGDQ